MAEMSILQLLQERFQAFNQAIGAQYEVLQTEAQAWHSKYEALQRENAHLKAQAPDSLCSPQRSLVADQDTFLSRVGPLDMESPGFAKDADFAQVVPGSVGLDANEGEAPMDAWLEAKPDDDIADDAGSNSSEMSKRITLFSSEISVIHPAAPEVRPSSSPSNAMRPTLRRSTLTGDIDEYALLNFAPREHFVGDRTLQTALKKGKTDALNHILSNDHIARSSTSSRITQQWHFVISPGSATDLVWECLGFLFVFFDFVMLPVQLLADEDFVPAAVDIVVYLMRVYWTLDIAMGFFKGYFDPKSGKPELSLKKIALRYATTVLTFDVAMTVADWTVFFVGQGHAAAQLVRFLRLMRLLRLARLLQRAQKAFTFLIFHVRSDSLLLGIELFKVVVCCLAWIHPIACGFYAVGRLDKAGWVDYYNVNEGNLWSRYITSCHWSLSQLTGDSGHVPQTDMERTYATIVLILAFVLSTLVICNLTTIMTQSQLVVAEKTRQLITLKMFLSDNNVSRRLATRIVEYATNGIEEQRRSPLEGMVDLLQELSTPLLTELHYDIFHTVLVEHPFFLGYDRANQRGLRAVCHTAVMKSRTAPGDVLFSSGESQEIPQMYMLLKGELQYTLHDSEMNLESGDCVNEATLWTHWPLQLGTLRSTAEGQVLCIQSIPFGRACHQFQTECFYPARYAQRFVQELNGAAETDILETFEFIDSRLLANEVFGSFMSRYGGALSNQSYSLQSVRGSIMRWKP